MAHSQKLSLLSAILININIMLGSGIFINTVLLTKQAGSLGATVYLLVGLMLLPLIFTIAELLQYHNESGTFYDFGLSISPFFGFLSSWSYFTGKLCSAALGIHVCLSFLQQIVPALQTIPLLAFDGLVITLFAFLNMLNLRAGTNIQYSFVFLKMVPIIFVITTGLFFVQGSYFSPETFLWSGIPSSIPLVLYAFSGFEASCSLSRHIENPKKNGPRAVLISFAVALGGTFLYQLLFYSTLGTYLGTLTKGYLEAFPAFLSVIFSPSNPLKNSIQAILHIAIASSSLGAAYGVMYSNSWNLFTLAHNNHIFGKKLFTKLNKYGMPIFCVLVEAFLIFFYILITQGNQVPLQQVGALGSTIAYTLSAFSLLALSYKKEHIRKAVPYLGVISCLTLISSFIWVIATQGPTPLLFGFMGLLFFGSYMFYRMHQATIANNVFEKL